MLGRSILGLDIGSWSVKACELRQEIRGCSLVRFESQQLPESSADEERYQALGLRVGVEGEFEGFARRVWVLKTVALHRCELDEHRGARLGVVDCERGAAFERVDQRGVVAEVRERFGQRFDDECVFGRRRDRALEMR